MRKRELRARLRDARRELKGWKRRALRQRDLIAELRLALDLAAPRVPWRDAQELGIRYEEPTPREGSDRERGERLQALRGVMIPVRKCGAFNRHASHVHGDEPDQAWCDGTGGE